SVGPLAGVGRSDPGCVAALGSTRYGEQVREPDQGGTVAYPVVPARPTRPGSVTVAGVLVFAAAAALLAMAVAQFLIIGPVGQAVEEVTTDPAEEGLGTALAAVLFGGGGVLNALVALSLGILAGFDLAGKRAARVMTWIVAPLGLVCCGCLSAVYTEF